MFFSIIEQVPSFIIYAWSHQNKLRIEKRWPKNEILWDCLTGKTIKCLWWSSLLASALKLESKILFSQVCRKNLYWFPLSKAWCLFPSALLPSRYGFKQNINHCSYLSRSQSGLFPRCPMPLEVLWEKSILPLVLSYLSSKPSWATSLHTLWSQAFVFFTGHLPCWWLRTLQSTRHFKLCYFYFPLGAIFLQIIWFL